MILLKPFTGGVQLKLKVKIFQTMIYFTGCVD